MTGYVAEVPADVHERVGVVTGVYDHDVAVGIAGPDEPGWLLLACLECGFVSDDTRRFLHEDCDRALNPVAKTVPEHLDGEA